MFPVIIFAPLYLTLVLIKRVRLRLLPTPHVTFFASVSTFGKSSIDSGMSAGLSRSFDSATSSSSKVLSAVERYDATMWLLALWKSISGQDLDKLLVADSESLQQESVTTALPTEKRLWTDMALLRQGLRRREYDLVWAVSSSSLVWAVSSNNLVNPVTKVPRGKSPTMSVKLPMLRALETNCTHLDTVPTHVKTWADMSKY
jgi:hypothetical protein